MKIRIDQTKPQDIAVKIAVKKLKKLCDREGVTKEMKRKAYYEKPSQIAARKKRRAIRTTQMAQAPVRRPGKQRGS